MFLKSSRPETRPGYSYRIESLVIPAKAGIQETSEVPKPGIGNSSSKISTPAPLHPDTPNESP